MSARLRASSSSAAAAGGTIRPPLSDVRNTVSDRSGTNKALGRTGGTTSTATYLDSTSASRSRHQRQQQQQQQYHESSSSSSSSSRVLVPPNLRSGGATGGSGRMSVLNSPAVRQPIGGGGGAAKRDSSSRNVLAGAAAVRRQLGYHGASSHGGGSGHAHHHHHRGSGHNNNNNAATADADNDPFGRGGGGHLAPCDSSVASSLSSTSAKEEEEHRHHHRNQHGHHHDGYNRAAATTTSVDPEQDAVIKAVSELREKRVQSQNRRQQRENRRQQQQQQQQQRTNDHSHSTKEGEVGVGPPPVSSVRVRESKSNHSQSSKPGTTALPRPPARDPPPSSSSAAVGAGERAPSPFDGAEAAPAAPPAITTTQKFSVSQHELDQLIEERVQHETQHKTRVYKGKTYEAHVRLKSAEEKIASLQEELDELRFFKEIESDTKKKKSADSRRVKELEGVIDNLRRANSELVDEKASLQATVEMCDMAMANAKDDGAAEVEAAQRRIDELEKALGDARTELERERTKFDEREAKLQASIDRKKSELVDKKRDLQEGVDIVRGLERKVEEARSDVAKEKAVSADLRDELQRVQTQCQTDLDTMRQSMEDAKAEQEKDTTRRAGYEAMYKQKADQLEKELEVTYKEQTDKIFALENELSERDALHETKVKALEEAQHKALKDKDDVVAFQRTKWKSTETKLLRELSKKESDLTTLKKTSEQTIADLRDEVQTTQTQAKAAAVAELESRHQEQLEIVEAKVDELTSSLEQAQKDLTSERAEHDATRSDLQETLGRTLSKLSSEEQVSKERNERIIELEGSLRDAEDALADVECKFEEKTVQIQSLLTKLQASRDQLTEEKEDLRKQLESDHAQQTERLETEKADAVRRLRREITAMEQSAKELEESNGQLKTQLEEAVESLVAQSSAVERLEEDLIACKQRMKENDERYEDKLRSLKEEVAEHRFLFKSHDGLKADVDRLTGELEAEKAKLDQCRKVRTKAEDDFDREKDRLTSTVRELRKKYADSDAENKSLEATIEMYKMSLESAEEGNDDDLRRVESRLKEVEEAYTGTTKRLEAMVLSVSSKTDEIQSLTTRLHQKEEELIYANALAAEYREKAHAKETTVKEIKEMEEKHRGTQKSLDYFKMRIDQVNKKNAALELELKKLKEASATAPPRMRYVGGSGRSSPLTPEESDAARAKVFGLTEDDDSRRRIEEDALRKYASQRWRSKPSPERSG